MSDHLFALMLGGKHEKALIELHDVVFVLAKDHETAFLKASALWFGTPSTVHVDAWQDLNVIDGHACSLEAIPSEGSLYFVNLGAYVPGQFGEQHSYFFFIAPDKKTARERARHLLPKSLSLPHYDNTELVDELVEVNQVSGVPLYWQKSDQTPQAPITGYFPLTKYMPKAP